MKFYEKKSEWFSFLKHTRSPIAPPVLAEIKHEFFAAAALVHS